ncbi:unnamed protein product [Vicia faba]|uniref:Uncharacterized protein n=1 Tax=Vicia faba TaxID=3906 RepID=A0AAV1ALX0_VICFA|nr:unnamed protein product [Vicia faba]
MYEVHSIFYYNSKLTMIHYTKSSYFITKLQESCKRYIKNFKVFFPNFHNFHPLKHFFSFKIPSASLLELIQNSILNLASMLNKISCYQNCSHKGVVSACSNPSEHLESCPAATFSNHVQPCISVELVQEILRNNSLKSNSNGKPVWHKIENSNLISILTSN